MLPLLLVVAVRGRTIVKPGDTPGHIPIATTPNAPPELMTFSKGRAVMRAIMSKVSLDLSFSLTARTGYVHFGDYLLILCSYRPIMSIMP